MKNRVFIFDLDDTLYPERDFVRSGFRAVDHWLETETGRSGLAEIAWRRFMEGERGNIFNSTLIELGIPVTPDLVGRMITVYRTHEPSISLSQECRDTLAALADSFHMAILTDGFLLTQQRKVEALRLSELAELVVYTDVWGREFWKPCDRGFRAVGEFFGLEPAAHTYIGDNPGKDFKAPNELGWQTIHLSGAGEYRAVKPAPGHEAHRAISSLKELLSLRPLVGALCR